MNSAPQFSGLTKLTLLLLLVLIPSVGAVLIPSDHHQNQENPSNINRAPQPYTVDRITHNQGNIITTVDNYGYIGGYSYYNLPSGQWPRNSGHDYIGELLYWMGAVDITDDTLVADTYDDFQAMPMEVGGNSEYTIYLSTDTSRYWNYDTSDTVGAGIESPANGWRIWSTTDNTYVYNQNFDQLSSAYEPGGPTSLQESHYRFNDAASGSPLLGVELTQTILQWNYCYNEDFMFVKLEIKNTSSIDYPNFAFGLYMDIDVGGPDGTGENGRLGDLVDYDVSENLAWMYDADGIDPGWGDNCGIMGTKLLQTPQDIGMTAIRVGEWELFGQLNDQQKFEKMDEATFDTANDAADLLYIQCTSGINLTAGATVQVVYAIIAGEDEADFRANADIAQQLYDSDYIGPEPPPTPTLRATPADGKVYLYWDNAAQNGLDPLSGENDFSGYKLYRSDNQGKTWGKEAKTKNTCLDIDYTPIMTQFVDDPSDPMRHSYIDENLYNGVEYWYCLSALDRGDEVAGVDVLQSGFGIAGEVINVVSVTPRTSPAGLLPAAARVDHDYDGIEQPSQGYVVPVLFDASQATGSEYEVSFEDTPSRTRWHLINQTSGDTVLANQTNFGGDPNEFEVGEGLRVYVEDAEVMPASYSQIAYGSSPTLTIADFFGPYLVNFYGVEEYAFGKAQYRATYEFRYSTDSTIMYDIDLSASSRIPFEVWNMTTNQRVYLSWEEATADGIWTPDELLIVIDVPYDSLSDYDTDGGWPYYIGWAFTFDETQYNPSAGDIFEIEGAPLFGPEDKYSFKLDGIDASAAANQLKDIKVVPNPYFAQYSAQVETSLGESVIEFQHLPDKCTIRIYTLAGDLVETIDHSANGGTARWDLLSSDQIQIASGVYLFHVDSPYGEHLGRFSVIK